MTDQAKLEAALYAANETIRLKDAKIAELRAENERLKERCDADYERRLPCREAEVAQKRYEEAEANAEFYERRAVEAERDSDKQYKLRAQVEVDRNELQERVDDLLATLAVTEAERDKLRAENKRLNASIVQIIGPTHPVPCEHINTRRRFDGELVCLTCGAILRDGRWVPLCDSTWPQDFYTTKKPEGR